jgi:hypothetical protein
VYYGVFNSSMAYTYYTNGLKKTFTSPDSTVYTYAYDNANQLKQVQIPNLGMITVNEYRWNRPKTVSTATPMTIWITSRPRAPGTGTMRINTTPCTG